MHEGFILRHEGILRAVRVPIKFAGPALLRCPCFDGFSGTGTPACAPLLAQRSPISHPPSHRKGDGHHRLFILSFEGTAVCFTLRGAGERWDSFAFFSTIVIPFALRNERPT